MSRGTLVPLEVRAAVTDTVHSYARAVDRSDWNLLRSLYRQDATIDHGQYQGDVDGFIDFVRGRRQGIVHTAHYVTNVLVEHVAKGAVAVEAYGWAVQTFAAPSPLVDDKWAGTTYRSSYRYIDLLMEHEDAWVFVETHLILGDLDIEHHKTAPMRRAGPSQLPSTEDRLYELLAGWRS